MSISSRACLVSICLAVVACGGSSGNPSGGDAPDAGDLDGSTGTTPVVDGGSGSDAASDGGVGAVCSVPDVKITHGAGVASPMITHVVSLVTHPNAVCNDGTPAAYGLRPGLNGAAKRWIIYLDGGGSCGDGPSCAQRYKQTPGYMTSGNAVEGATFNGMIGGIKSSDPTVNPDFYDATFVNLNYCSSDQWSGDKAGNMALPTSDAGRWNFRGREIVRSVVADLMAKGLSQATEVVLMGSSAGALGMFANVDDVRAAVPGARFVAVADAGFAFDYPDFDAVTASESTAMPTARAMELAASAALWGGSGDTSCEASAKDMAAHALCRSPYDLLMGHHLDATFFIRQSEYDQVQLKMLLAASQTGRNAAVAAPYEKRFAAAMAKNLNAAVAASGGNVTAFGVNDDQHGVVNDDTLWPVSAAEGALLPATFGAWYRSPCMAASHVTTP
jgi:hypothetical protein